MQPKGFIAGAVIAAVGATSFGVPAAAIGRSPHAPGAPAVQRGTSTPNVTHVDVVDFRFESSDVSIGRGDTVTFDFVGSETHHTATDGTGMELYDSGSVAPGGPSFSFTFESAGTFRFICKPHIEMSGLVRVPMRVSPIRGGMHRTFTATWASQTAPGGFVYDVQIRRPGKAWKHWRTGTVDRQRGFVPTSGTGTYRFRARLRGLNGGRSMWSTQSAIRVG